MSRQLFKADCNGILKKAYICMEWSLLNTPDAVLAEPSLYVLRPARSHIARLERCRRVYNSVFGSATARGAII